MASARSHVKPILLARTTTLVAKLLSAVFLVSLAIISRLEARSGQWYTPERRIEILSLLAIVGLAFQAYAIAAEHFPHQFLSFLIGSNTVTRNELPVVRPFANSEWIKEQKARRD